MAKNEKENLGELCHFSVCKAENGYKLSFCFEGSSSLSQKAGWVPMSMCSKEYVEKTKPAVLDRIKKVFEGEF